MTELQLYNQIASLPPELQQEVADFVAFLKQKAKEGYRNIKQRKPGVAKGLITMSPDFDEPLEDFKDYM